MSWDPPEDWVPVPYQSPTDWWVLLALNISMAAVQSIIEGPVRLGNTTRCGDVGPGMEDNSTPPSITAPTVVEAPKAAEIVAEAPKPAKPAAAKEPLVTKGRQVLYLQHSAQEPHTALVVKIWADNCVTLKVTDERGQDYVVTSVTKGTGVGQWSYPARVS